MMLPYSLVEKLESLIKHCNTRAAEPHGISFLEMISVVGAMAMLGQNEQVQKLKNQLVDCEIQTSSSNVVCMQSYLERKRGD
jgi:hypothetical protein